MPFIEVLLSGKWEPYDSRVGKPMAEAIQRGAREHHFKMRDREYLADFNTMMQYSIDKHGRKGKGRPIRDKHAFRPKHDRAKGDAPPKLVLTPDPGMRIVTVPAPKGGWPRPGEKVSFTVDGNQYFLQVTEETLKQKFVKIQVPEVTSVGALKEAMAKAEEPAPAAPEKKGTERTTFSTAVKAGLLTGVLAIGGLIATGEIDVAELKEMGVDALVAGEGIALDCGEAIAEGADMGGALVMDAADELVDALDGLM